MIKRNKYIKKIGKVLELIQIYEDSDGMLYEMNLGELKEMVKIA